MRRILTLSLLLVFMASCKSTVEVTAPVEPTSDSNLPIHTLFEQSEAFSQSMTGFALYDPESDSMLYERDSNQFYVPASNTKILTLYASLKSLPKTLPSLRYTVQNDTLYFQGTGDPGFLIPNFDFSESYDFLSGRDEVLVFTDQNYADEHFGSGWAWDWY